MLKLLIWSGIRISWYNHIPFYLVLYSVAFVKHVAGIGRPMPDASWLSDNSDSTRHQMYLLGNRPYRIPMCFMRSMGPATLHEGETVCETLSIKFEGYEDSEWPVTRNWPCPDIWQWPLSSAYLTSSFACSICDSDRQLRILYRNYFKV